MYSYNCALKIKKLKIYKKWSMIRGRSVGVRKFQVASGVTQSCILSRLLFHLVLDWVMARVNLPQGIAWRSSCRPPSQRRQAYFAEFEKILFGGLHVGKSLVKVDRAKDDYVENC